jgi:hypothetical protein
LAAWDRAHATQDVDLLIGMSGLRLQSLLSRLHQEGFRAKGRQVVVRVDDAEFIQLMFAVPDTVLEIQVDLLFADTEFQRQALSRRVPLNHAELGCGLLVLSCEDLILMKLQAGRIIDIVDAAGLLHTNRQDLDMPYLMGWIERRGLQRQFAVVSQEAARLDALPE